ncbi:MAG: ribokinase [Ruminococcaceae bacterium]|nr:ribokinase [Oscillospiraceae bacterium]
MQKKILVIGSANMDFSMNFYKMPERGETLVDDGGVAYVPGGKGANAAIAFKRLGADSVLCAKLGADVHGQKLYNYYKELGLNTSSVKVDHDNPTGLAVVMREGDGSNRIIVYPGANNHLTTEGIIEAFECNPDAVYLGFEIPFQTVVNAAKVAASKNIPIFIDAAPANKEYDLEKLPPVEIFSPNETETFEFTGIMPNSMESSLRAALALSRKVKAKYIVIKQGARGAFLYDGKRYNTFPAIKTSKVVDTTAAGDAFTAALTLEYLRTQDIREAIKYANAAGAITISRPGSASSVPTAEEVAQVMSCAE